MIDPRLRAMDLILRLIGRPLNSLPVLNAIEEAIKDAYMLGYEEGRDGL